MKTNFTKKYVDSLKPRETRYCVYDKPTRGLLVMVFPSGVRSYYHLKKILGTTTRTLIGDAAHLTVENARAKADELNSALAKWKSNRHEGPSPLERERPRGGTFGEAVEAYVTGHIEANAKRPERAMKWCRWAASKYLSSWSGRSLASITRAEVRARHQDIGAKHGKTIANRVIELAGRVYGFAASDGDYEGVIPTDGVNGFKEQSRERFLSAAEIERLWAAMDPNSDIAHFCVLAITCGARRSDITSMRWSDVNLETATWNVPDSKGGAYQIALADPAIAVLNKRVALKGISPTWVFPSPRGSKSGHVEEIKKSFHGLLKRAGIEDFRCHDMRRTFGALLAADGQSIPVIAKALGHKDFSSAQVYARLDLSPVRAAVDRAAKRLPA